MCEYIYIYIYIFIYIYIYIYLYIYIYIYIYLDVFGVYMCYLQNICFLSLLGVFDLISVAYKYTETEIKNICIKIYFTISNS